MLKAAAGAPEYLHPPPILYSRGSQPVGRDRKVGRRASLSGVGHTRGFVAKKSICSLLGIGAMSWVANVLKWLRTPAPYRKPFFPSGAIHFAPL